MIHLDTSALVDALTGPKRSARILRDWIESGELVGVSAVVLYEWRRGPRRSEEIAVQDALFPPDKAAPFGPREAILAAELFRQVRGTRRRAVDLAIAACALTHEAALWTLNVHDFQDVPGLRLA